MRHSGDANSPASDQPEIVKAIAKEVASAVEVQVEKAVSEKMGAVEEKMQLMLERFHKVLVQEMYTITMDAAAAAAGGHGHGHGHVHGHGHGHHAARKRTAHPGTTVDVEHPVVLFSAGGPGAADATADTAEEEALRKAEEEEEEKIHKKECVCHDCVCHDCPHTPHSRGPQLASRRLRLVSARPAGGPARSACTVAERPPPPHAPP